MNSLKLSIAGLEDTIRKKSVFVKDMYIKEFVVSLGDFVSAGSELVKAYDVSKSKLIVYVSSDDYKNIRNKSVYIDAKEGVATIEKVDSTLDETYVSAYKVTLVLNSSDFGKTVKVEFK
jgi:hypothetical protein